MNGSDNGAEPDSPESHKGNILLAKHIDKWHQVRQAVDKKARKNTMDDELTFNKYSRCWEGISPDGKRDLTVSGTAMAEARHIMTMRGISPTISYPQLLLIATWLNDETLLDLDGVELT